MSRAMPSATPNSRIVELAELAMAKSPSGQPLEHGGGARARRSAPCRRRPWPAARGRRSRPSRSRSARRTRPASRSAGRARPGAARGGRSGPASAPAIGATTIGAAVHGRVRRPASSGRVALHDLEVLREQEDGAEHADREGQADHVGHREAARGEQPQREHGVGAAAGPGDVRRHQQPGQRPAGPGRAGEPQPSSLPCTMPQMPRNTAPPSSDGADQVEPLPGAPGLAAPPAAAAAGRPGRPGR